MSKPLNPHVRLDLTHVVPAGALVRHTVRMGLYWLCTTILLWPSLHPFGEWRPLTILSFLAISSLVVPALGYLSLLLRGSTPANPSEHRSPASLTLSLTGIVAAEILVVVFAALATGRLLF